MRAAPYTRLAGVYDAIMGDVDYDDWVTFLVDEATRRGYVGGPILDLACGTGNATRPAVARGYDVEGLDVAPAMLAVARARLPDVTFHEGDATALALPRRYALVYSVFDALNNLLDDDAFLAMARGVHAHLVPGGVFAFDANTRAGLRDLWGGRAEGWAGDVYYRWTHRYDADADLATVEAHCDGPDGPFTEVHVERPYDPADLRRLLTAAGFADVDVVTYPDAAPAGDDEERVWAFARRPA